MRMSRSAWSRRAWAARRAARTGSVACQVALTERRWRAGVVMRESPSGAVEAFAEGAGDVVGLVGAAGGAGAAGAERLGDCSALGGGGLPFGQREVGPVEIGHAQAAAPQDLGGGSLPARA